VNNSMRTSGAFFTMDSSIMAIKTAKLERFAKPKNSKVGRVLVVGPGQRGRGGIAAVIRMHQNTPTWLKRKTRLLPTSTQTSCSSS